MYNIGPFIISIQINMPMHTWNKQQVHNLRYIADAA